MIKGYEFAKDQYVMFTAEELKALEEKGSQTIDIITFIPVAAIDPIYYDKAYYLAPDKGGARPYSLLIQGMRETGRCALAKWAWKGKQYMVQVRPSGDGLVLQQLMYADEVRSMKELDIEPTEVKRPELDLAIQLINQIAVDSYDAAAYEDEVKKRIQAAINLKVEGSTYPNWTGTEQKRTIITFAGDDLKWSVAASIGGTGEVGWKRVK